MEIFKPHQSENKKITNSENHDQETKGVNEIPKDLKEELSRITSEQREVIEQEAGVLGVEMPQERQLTRGMIGWEGETGSLVDLGVREEEGGVESGGQEISPEYFQAEDDLLRGAFQEVSGGLIDQMPDGCMVIYLSSAKKFYELDEEALGSLMELSSERFNGEIDQDEYIRSIQENISALGDLVPNEDLPPGLQEAELSQITH